MQTWPQPVKVHEIGPMFRYDRPQAGRYRQFWQFDIEAIGDAGPAVDAETIELAARFLADAGVTGVQVLLNSIGDAACRPAYIESLTAFYEARTDQLPASERDRLGRNVLRLLDSKDPAMAAINAGAPRMTDMLCGPCAAHFGELRAHLDALEVAYRLEPGLVRGLDYYTRTAFELYVVGREGQQQALGGGGRYDGLVELLGGRPGRAGSRRQARPEDRHGRHGRGRRRRPGRHRDPAAHRNLPARRRGFGPSRPRPAQARQAARGRVP
jgi:histidyl-tRNA synthetase